MKETQAIRIFKTLGHIEASLECLEIHILDVLDRLENSQAGQSPTPVLRNGDQAVADALQRITSSTRP